MSRSAILQQLEKRDSRFALGLHTSLNDVDALSRFTSGRNICPD